MGRYPETLGEYLNIDLSLARRICVGTKEYSPVMSWTLENEGVRYADIAA